MSGKSAHGGPRRVNLTRVAAGGFVDVVFPDDGIIRGLFYHWLAKKGVYCRGQANCMPCGKRAERIWRGYAAVQVIDSKAGTMTPGVVEVTESCELDLRHQVEPLQVWRLERPVDAKGKLATMSARVVGKLPEAPTRAVWVAAIDVVRWVYHCPDLELDQVNPVPSRLLVESIAIPGFTMPKADDTFTAPTAEQKAALKARLMALAAAKALPAEKDGEQ